MTDNQGATATTTRTVSPTGPPPVGYARDSFTRTTSGGWGTAESGGAWTTNNAGSQFAVNAGTASITMTAGSGPSMYLTGVSSTDTDVQVTATTDKAPTGGGIYLSAVARRLVGVGDYRAKVHLLASGQVALSLLRLSSTGAETTIRAEAVVPGLTYAAGSNLRIRVQATGTNPTTVRAKVWSVASTEPTAWAASVTDTTANLQAAGGVGLMSYLSSTATNAPTVARFDDFQAGPTNPTTTTTPCGSSAAPPARYQHVVVIMEENRTWADVGGVGFADPNMPYLHDLGSKCTAFSDWTETNTSQNSLNQYIGLTSGVSNPLTVDDCSPSTTCQSTDDNIFRQVRVSGATARNFVEGATTGCSAAGNADKHIPDLYFYGTYTDGSGVHNDHDFCNTEVRPLSELDVNNLPTFSILTPNLCNDGHDCANANVDAWAAQHIQPILDSSAYAAGTTAVFVLYDEDRPVPNLIIAPTASPGPNATAGAGHPAALRAWEDMLGLPVMAQPAVQGAISLRSAAHI